MTSLLHFHLDDNDVDLKTGDGKQGGSLCHLLVGADFTPDSFCWSRARRKKCAWKFVGQRDKFVGP